MLKNLKMFFITGLFLRTINGALKTIESSQLREMTGHDPLFKTGAVYQSSNPKPTRLIDFRFGLAICKFWILT
jgi:hypothetical protein